jgi:hypothetical protein
LLLFATLVLLAVPLGGRAEERRGATGADRTKGKLSIKLEFGFVGTAPTAEPGVFIGNIQLLASGSGTDVVDSITCAQGWNARIVIPKSREEQNMFNAAGQVVISSVGVTLVPGGWIGWSFDPSNDEGHLEFSGGLEPLKVGSRLRCSFNFHRSGRIITVFKIIKDTKSLIFGF